MGKKSNKKKKSCEMKTIFCAYPSERKEFKDWFQQAKNLHNKYSGKKIQYKLNLWEDVCTNSQIIINKIKEVIEESDNFGCDLTSFNWNVFFELGYAIGKNKPTKIFIEDNDTELKKYKKLKILSDCGYTKYSSKHEITKEINSNFDIQQQSSINTFAQACASDSEESNDSGHILLISNRSEDQAIIEIKNYLDTKEILYSYNNIKEANFRHRDWYKEHIKKADGIIINLSCEDEEDKKIENAEHSFIGGICEAIEKPLLFVGHSSMKQPMDYKDKFHSYKREADVGKGVNEFFKSYIKPILAIREVQKKKTSRKKTAENDAIRLALNFIAEDEQNLLLNYYVENKFYKQALENQYKIIAGRKGSGKTALFIKLRNELTSKSDRILAILNPDKSDFRSNIELLENLNKDFDQNRIMSAIWEIVILSIFCREINRYIDDNKSEKNNEHAEIKEILDENQYDGFFKALESYNNSNTHPLEFRKSKKYKTLRDYFFNYIDTNKFITICIIADNLDCIWDDKISMKIQAGIIKSIFDYTNDLKTQLNNKGKKINISIFLREDILLYIKRELDFEIDKLGARTIMMNWKNNTDDLRDIIDIRFSKSINSQDELEIENVWLDHFQKEGSHAFSDILKHVIPRPRDLLKFIGLLFEYAEDGKITSKTYEEADKLYVDFIYDNMILELASLYPNIKDILNAIKSSFANISEKMEAYYFIKVIKKELKDESRLFPFIDSMINLNYLICSINNKVYKDIDAIQKKFYEKKWYIIRKHKIYFQLVDKPL